MTRVQHILFPIDLAGRSGDVAGYVRQLARSAGARLTVYAVVPPPVEPASVELHRTLRQRLDEVVREEFGDIAAKGVWEPGDPALRIVAFARAHQVDLIAMPTHGVGLFRRLLIGSVTSKVLHDAPCAVWTAAHAQAQMALQVPRTILCAVDKTADALDVIQWAGEFAGVLNARLQLLHVVDPISDWPSLESERELQEQARTDARARLESMLEAAKIDAPLRVAVGHTVQTVTECARQEGADLLFIGRGSAFASVGQLRANAFGIIQRSLCPVISVAARIEARATRPDLLEQSLGKATI